MDSVRRAEADKHNERRLEIIILCIRLRSFHVSEYNSPAFRSIRVDYSAAKISVIANFRRIGPYFARKFLAPLCQV